jgi:lysophospholipase L1-like esterase
MELGVRIARPQNLSGSWSVATETGLVVNRSSGGARHQLGERVVHYRFHAPHLRDTPLPDHGLRVLVVGDSFTFGWLLGHADTYIAELQRRADEGFGAGVFHFLNGAAGGWGTGDYVAFVEDFGDAIEPDAVLVFINSDDIGRSLRRPLFRSAPGGKGELERQTLPRSSLKRLLNALPPYQWLLEHSHLLQLARSTFLLLGAPAHPPDGAVSEGPRSVGLGVSRREAVALGRVLFARLRSWCDRRDVALWVATTGWYDASSDERDEPTRMFVSEASDVFAELRVPFEDLAPYVFEEKSASPDAYLVVGDPHPNERGARLVGEAAWRYFVRERLEALCAEHPACKLDR